ncbi:hypothetical protein ACOMHN_049417 [Nucella lapillus]
MKEINYITQNATNNSLIIIDELGRGLKLAEMSTMPAEVLQDAQQLAHHLDTVRQKNETVDPEVSRQRAVFKLATKLLQLARNSRLEDQSLRTYLTSLHQQHCTQLLKRPQAAGAGEGHGSSTRDEQHSHIPANQAKASFHDSTQDPLHDKGAEETGQRGSRSTECPAESSGEVPGQQPQQQCVNTSSQALCESGSRDCTSLQSQHASVGQAHSSQHPTEAISNSQLRSQADISHKSGPSHRQDYESSQLRSQADISHKSGPSDRQDYESSQLRSQADISHKSGPSHRQGFESSQLRSQADISHKSGPSHRQDYESSQLRSQADISHKSGPSHRQGFESTIPRVNESEKLSEEQSGDRQLLPAGDENRDTLEASRDSDVNRRRAEWIMTQCSEVQRKQVQEHDVVRKYPRLADEKSASQPTRVFRSV